MYEIQRYLQMFVMFKNDIFYLLLEDWLFSIVASFQSDLRNSATETWKEIVQI